MSRTCTRFKDPLAEIEFLGEQVNMWRQAYKDEIEARCQLARECGRMEADKPRTFDDVKCNLQINYNYDGFYRCLRIKPKMFKKLIELIDRCRDDLPGSGCTIEFNLCDNS